MAIGFAAVSTTLIINGTAKVSENTEDFSVIFTSATLDGTDVYNEVIDNTKKIITFETSDLKTLNQTSVLNYEVTNNSNNYDAEVSVNCKLKDNSEVNHTSIKNELEGNVTKILAKETLSGTLTITLEKSVTEEVKEEYICVLEVNAVERNELGYNGSTMWAFDYIGNEQAFIAPIKAKYKIELWGAQNGAYTSGTINLAKDTKLFVYVGGAGNDNNSSSLAGGWNGGGGTNMSTSKVHGTSGAGATDIRLVEGNWNSFESLKSRIMVASGGGTAPGGGLYGVAGQELENYTANYGTQIKGGATPIHHSCGLQNGTAGGFGYGGSGGGNAGFSTSGGGCGGGSGYYGGSGSSGICNGSLRAASGSSFISGHNGCDAIKEESTSSNIIHTGQPNHYSGYIFNNTIMIDGSGYNWTTEKGEQTGMPSHDGTSTIMENAGNGYARITLIK